MFQLIPAVANFEGEIAGSTIDNTIVTSEVIVVKGFYMLIVEHGSVTVSINGEAEQRLLQRDMMFLFLETTVRFIKAERGFSAKHIMLSNEFAYGLAMPRNLFPEGFFSEQRDTPISHLGVKYMPLISMRLGAVIDALKGVDHRFHREMVLCSVAMMLLDISNIVPRTSRSRQDISTSRMDDILHEFVKMLDEYGNEKHDIPFYAGKLCITPQYLSRLVRMRTTKTVYFHISQVLMVEAKRLLRGKYGSIQQISEKMNFSDQASFGKFFKKHEGVSPIEYRKKW